MPLFTIETNVPQNKVPADFLKTTTAVLAKTLNKPESYCSIHLKAGQEYLSFGGTSAPCGYATLMSIGELGPERNQAHSAVLFKHLKETLGIPPDRFYIQFIDAKPTEIGWNGATFEGML